MSRSPTILEYEWVLSGYSIGHFLHTPNFADEMYGYGSRQVI